MSSELSTGAVFAERYRVERRLASGGMGAVYEVVHIETNRRRALKVLHAKFMQSEAVRIRFRQEARVVAEIDSEHIVDVFDAGIDTETGMPFLVMELLRGEDLGVRVRRNGPMPRDEVVRCLLETSLALEKTHKANIVHRDLKPDNLFLCEREYGLPRIKVLDFGIAKIVAEGAEESHATQAVGTPLYMAPEQFLMNGSVSAATDIFALGLIAYTLLVGKPYWLTESKAAGSPIAFALQASKGPEESAVERAAKRAIQLPPAFDAWFFRATAAKPEDRFPLVMAAISELAEVLCVPLVHDSMRARSIPPPPMADQSTASLGGNMPAAVDETIAPSGPSSGTLPSVRTVGSSGHVEARPPSRRMPILLLVSGVLTLVAGPVIEALLGTHPRRQLTTTSSATSAVSTNIVVEIAQSAATNPDTSASAAAVPPIAEATSAKPIPSASSTGTAPFKSPLVQATGTTKKPSNPLIWNND